MEVERSDGALPTRTHLFERAQAAVASNLPLLVEGPIGCGKTTFVQQLAHAADARLAVVQLGEQTDAKGLLGGYECSDVPGEFRWADSQLTEAVRGGGWLLLEDVDLAGADVLAALAALADTRRLRLPVGGRVDAHPRFRLFLTLRTADPSSRVAENKRAYLDKFWLRIRLPPFSDHELQRLMSTSYPALEAVSRRFVEIFNDVSAKLVELGKMRLVGSRDLFKFCERLQGRGIVEGDAVAIFQEARDVFCSHLPTAADRLTLMKLVAAKLNVNSEEVDYYHRKHCPTVRLRDDEVVFGRTILTRHADDSAERFAPRNECFALTKAVCQLLEQIATAVASAESVLLVGETGAGKTAAVQFVARHAGRQLHVLNMSQFSDSADLLGGFKPVGAAAAVAPLRRHFAQLFADSFDAAKNARFLRHVDECAKTERWPELLQLMLRSGERAVRAGRRAFEWRELLRRVRRVERVVRGGGGALPFARVEGVLLRAARLGHWLLLDEINLASAETLSCVAALPVERHADFRLFACMNPANDVGKRALPAGLRNRLTELFVNETDDDDDLLKVARAYLHGLNVTAKLLSALVAFYQAVRQRAHSLKSDSSGHSPNFSLRTFCRALSYAAKNAFGDKRRSLYEAFCMSFLTEVDDESRSVVLGMITKAILGSKPELVKGIINSPIPQPTSDAPGASFVQVEGYWLERGELAPKEDASYVLTATVRKNVRDVARVVAARNYAVLLQGETSVGKTSLVSHLAALTGNEVVRINNHEHTDLQEYVGSYCSGADGKLRFVDGPLVRAMRLGQWVILDELNLAPGEVLEALNRLLDDNRELFVAETQTLVRPHRRFALFATQNPPGAYGGRKRLSRAFRNRFVELHFGELPPVELGEILTQRCRLAPRDAQRMVAVMKDLQLCRQSSGVFAGKESYVTLRDLFRWGERYRKFEPATGGAPFDWNEYVAEQGYLVLAGRCRRADDAAVVRHVVDKHFRTAIDVERLFDAASPYLTIDVNASVAGFEHIVWTANLRRMAVLLGQALKFDEPALLVGETGCGKTSLCQLLVAAEGKRMDCVSCHQMIEAADFLGRLRPAASGAAGSAALFEWRAGPLVTAMAAGDALLVDEMALAADAVLERLNSVLEPERTLTLADGPDERLTAAAGFQLMATMNPGGDYGKKELSRALRNRMTEMWAGADYELAELEAIVEKSVRPGLSLSHRPAAAAHSSASGLGAAIVEFVRWFQVEFSANLRCAVTVRDILSWVQFINKASELTGVREAYIHGACLVFLDGLPTKMASRSPDEVNKVRIDCMDFIGKQMGEEARDACFAAAEPLQVRGSKFGAHPFFIELGELERTLPSSYSLEAPTCRLNATRLLRALTLDKALLLEGPPGVGKSSLVVALAAAAGRPLTRLNLSDQTELSDLFGADVPCAAPDGGQSFAWLDGPLLRAINDGHWVLLDEMNLASQSVLEGLNAVLDHRGEVFVPELARSFRLRRGATRFFACQNPHAHGGSRRGLPKSFLNRFSTVYVEKLQASDELDILQRHNVGAAAVDEQTLRDMIRFNETVADEVCVKRTFGQLGSPWEFNLRDLLRWLSLMHKLKQPNPAYTVDVIYGCRLRSLEDRRQLCELFARIFGRWPSAPVAAWWADADWLRVGRARLRRQAPCDAVNESDALLRPLRSQLPALEALGLCARNNWLAILVGGAGSGKSSLVRMLAALCGRQLDTLHLSTESDALELLGSFEQTTTDDCSSLREPLVKLCEMVCVEYERSAAIHAIMDSLRETRAAAAVAATVQQVDDVLANLRTLNISERVAERLDELDARVDAARQQCALRFEWVDSALVRAYKQGGWLLVENVNCCSAAVLDRLNAALEVDGRLTLTERGLVDGLPDTVRPHPNFRLFFTMNARYGAISRAMRNRGVEICLADEGGWVARTDDAQDLLGAFGVAPSIAASLHAALSLARPSHPQLCALDGGVDAGVARPYTLIESGFDSSALSADQLGAVVRGVCGADVALTPVDAPAFVAAPPLGRLLADPAGVTGRYHVDLCLRAANDDKFVFHACQCQFLLSAECLKLLLLGTAAADLNKFVDQLNTPLVAAMGKLNLSDCSQLDLRFFGICQSPAKAESLNRNLLPIILGCVGLDAQQLQAERGSAVRICRRLKDHRMQSQQLPDEAIQFVENVLKALLKLCHSIRLDLDSQSLIQVLRGSWDLWLFARLSHAKLAQTTHCCDSVLPLRLAWRQLEKTFLSRLKSFSGGLELDESASELSARWSGDAAAERQFVALRSRLDVARPHADVDALAAAVARLAQPPPPVEEEGVAAVRGAVALVGALDDWAATDAPTTVVGESSAWRLLATTADLRRHRRLLLRLVWAADACLARHFVGDAELPLRNVHLALRSPLTECVSRLLRPLDSDSPLKVVALRDVDGVRRAAADLQGILWCRATLIGRLLSQLRCEFGQAVSDLKAELLHILTDIVPDKTFVGLAEELCAIDVPEVTDDRNESLAKAFVTIGMIVCDLTTPPRKMIDPVERHAAKRHLAQMKLNAIESSIAVLQRYFASVSADSLAGRDEADLAARHPHPYIRSLFVERRRLAAYLAKDAVDDRCGVRSPDGLSFDQLAYELSSFAQTTRAALQPLVVDICGGGGGGRSQSPLAAAIGVARLRGWLTSAERFGAALAAEQRRAAFADVWAPFLLGVGVAQLGANLLAASLAAAAQPPVVAPQSISGRLESSELGALLSDASSVPPKLQLAIAQSGLKSDCAASRDIALKWTLRIWTQIMPNKKEENLFVEKSKCDATTGEPPDEDELAMRARFPDYSDAADEVDDEDSAVDVARLTATDLCLLLDTMLGQAEVAEDVDSTWHYRLQLWLMEKRGGASWTAGDDGRLLAEHLAASRSLGAPPAAVDARRANVYTDGCVKSAATCCALVEALGAAAERLRAEWPDVAALGTIGEAAAGVRSLAAGAPLMRLAAGVERLLAECEQWERVASRACSLEQWLAPLRRLLVDWRQREIVGWQRLVDDLQQEARHAALVAALPVVEMIEQVRAGSAEANVLPAMLVSWMRSSTVGDYAARLNTIRLTRVWLQASGADYTNLVRRLVSLEAYFEQYLGAVNERLVEVTKPIEAELKDFVKVVKFQDLNLWTVKLSVQKAHKQLFRLVKRYKEVLNEPNVTMFSKLLPLPPWFDCTSEMAPSPQLSAMIASRVAGCPFAAHLERLPSLIERVSACLDASAAEQLGDLADQSASVRAALSRPIVYEGTAEQMQKQHGQALAQRQRAVASLLKDCRQLGLSYRRAQAVDAAALTEQLMLAIGSDCGGGGVERLVQLARQSGVHRAVLLSAAAKPHAQVRPQLAAACVGLSHVMPAQLVAHCRSLLGQLLPDARALRRMQRRLAALLSEARSGGAGGAPQDAARAAVVELHSHLTLARQQLRRCESLWQCCPSADVSQRWGDAAAPPISRWNRDDDQFSRAVERLRSAAARVQAVDSCIEAITLNVDYLNRETLEGALVATHCLDELTAELDSLVTCTVGEDSTRNEQGLVEPLLAARSHLVQCGGAREAVAALTERRKRRRVDSAALAAAADAATERLLCVVQVAVKRAPTATESDSLDVHEFVKNLHACLPARHLNQAVEAVNSVWSMASVGVDSATLLSADHVEALAATADRVCHLVERLLSFRVHCLTHYARATLRLQELGVKLLSEGFVEAVPRPQETSDGGGDVPTDFADSEPAGLGEGEGARDVSEQIEETGQVEGLRGEDDTPEDQPPPPTADDDDARPIDMEEDFGGALEDLQLGDDGDSGDDDDAEAPADWQMGDADEPQEEQLDPGLWKDEADEPKPDNQSQRPDGAQQPTDEMVAADDEPAQTAQDAADELAAAAQPDEAAADEAEETPADDEAGDNFENIDIRDEEAPGEEGDEDVEAMDEAEKEPQGEQDEEGVAQSEQDAAVDDDAAVEEEGVKQDDLVDFNAASASETGAGKAREEDASVVEPPVSEPKEPEIGQDEQSSNANAGDESRGLGDLDSTMAKDAGDATEAAEQADNDDDRANEQNRTDTAADEKTLGDAKELRQALRLDSASAAEQTRPTAAEGGGRWSHAAQLDADADGQAVDAATVEQAAQQPAAVDTLQRDDDVADAATEMDADGDATKDSSVAAVKIVPENADLAPEESADAQNRAEATDPSEQLRQDSTIHTAMDFYEHAAQLFSAQEVANFDMSSSQGELADKDSRGQWLQYELMTEGLAAELAENLRLTLEPTRASKLEGDYRTGKRLNVRKLIPYVASNFRKDKIWLRRTRLAARDYQVLIAVDDSASMRDRKTRQLALESVALLQGALQRLEVGSVAVCKFGESAEMLHAFGDAFTADAGARIVDSLRFEQNKTDVCRLLSFATGCLGARGGGGGGAAAAAQLLLVVSDGRGLFVDGVERAQRAARATQAAGVFVVFVVVDGAEKGGSILDVRLPLFDAAGGRPQIRAYMEFFPFPFYVILRQVQAMPAVVGDALQQWFQLLAADK